MVSLLNSSLGMIMNMVTLPEFAIWSNTPFCNLRGKFSNFEIFWGLKRVRGVQRENDTNNLLEGGWSSYTNFEGENGK